jgi:hypothetical protein
MRACVEGGAPMRCTGPTTWGCGQTLGGDGGIFPDL